MSLYSFIIQVYDYDANHNQVLFAFTNNHRSEVFQGDEEFEKGQNLYIFCSPLYFYYLLLSYAKSLIIIIFRFYIALNISTMSVSALQIYILLFLYYLPFDDERGNSPLCPPPPPFPSKHNRIPLQFR